MTTGVISQQKRFQNHVAMTVTLVSFAMLFAALFLGYFLVRFNVPVWPPVEIENRPQLTPFLSTLVIALSSLTFWRHKKTMGASKTWLHVTLGLGLAFLALQWSLWATLKTVGLTANNGMVSSMFYAFTWLHAAHIVGGLGALVWVAATPWTELRTENVGKFWHFLGVVWFLMYLMLFVF